MSGIRLILVLRGRVTGIRLILVLRGRVTGIRLRIEQSNKLPFDNIDPCGSE